MSRRSKNLIGTIPLLALSLFMSWVSAARTNIIATGCAVVSCGVITYSGRKDRTKWLPVLWLMAGILIAIYAYSHVGNGGLSTGVMTDASSFSDRFAIWSRFLDMFRTTNLLDLLVGYGLVQNGKIDPTGLGGSDNLYLAIVLHIGLIGLCLIMLLVWRLWQLIRKQAEMRTSYLTTAVAATYSTILLTGLFKINFFGVIFLFFAISDRSSPLRRDAEARGVDLATATGAVTLKTLNP